MATCCIDELGVLEVVVDFPSLRSSAEAYKWGNDEPVIYFPSFWHG